MGAIFFSPGDSHTKDCLSCFIWVWKVSLRLTLIQNGKSMSFKATPSNDRVLCTLALSGHSTREQLARECFLDLRKWENPDSSEFTHYNRSSGKRSRTDRVYTDIKVSSNTKINHTMVYFTDHYNVIFIERFPSKTKIGKESRYFNNSLLCKPEFSLTTKIFLFSLKTKNTTTLQQVISGKTLNLVLRNMLELFLKIQ